MKIEYINAELEQIKSIVNKLSDEIPRNFCPKCRKPIIYMPNPMYMTKCKSCNWKGYQSQLLNFEDIIYGNDK